MPTLWVFGDSFPTGLISDPIHNTKLNDPKFGGDPLGRSIYGKHWAFGKHIADNLQLNYINLSQGNLGNHDIVLCAARAAYNIKEEDLALVCLTTPWRTGHREGDNVLKLHFNDELKLLDKVLKGKKYLVTQGFCPLFPYFEDMFDFELEFDTSKHIEWGKPNNTLIDICAGSWLDGEQENFILAGRTFPDLTPLQAQKLHHLWHKESKYKFDTGVEGRSDNAINPSKDLIASCFHPTQAGHKLIGEVLTPYIKNLL